MARVLRGLGADGRSSGEPYLDAARRAAAFIRERMWNAGTRMLLRRYRDGARGNRGLRRRLRLSDFRTARAVSGRSASRCGSSGPSRCSASGRTVLGRRVWRLVQHDRAGSERAAPDERGLRRCRADRELGVGVEPPGAVAPRCRLDMERAHRADAAPVRDAARADGPRCADDGGGALDLRCRPFNRSSWPRATATTASIARWPYVTCRLRSSSASPARRSVRLPAACRLSAR